MSSCYNKKIKYGKDKRISLKKIMPKCNKRTYLSASATVEASIVIPIFIYAVMTVMYLIQIVGLQLKVSQALYNQSRKLAKYAYACDIKSGDDNGDGSGEYNQAIHNGVGLSLATTMMISELGTEYISKSHIVGGAAGFTMFTSKFMENDNIIDLTVIYSVKNPFDIFGIGIFTFKQKAVVCAWLGEDDNKEEIDSSQEDSPEQMVYITPSGTVYHDNRNCTYLLLSIHSITNNELKTVRNNNGAKYYACEKCGNKKIAGKLYVTDYGDRYHTSINCSKLKRSVISVPISSVVGMKKCSRCGGEE